MKFIGESAETLDITKIEAIVENQESMENIRHLDASIAVMTVWQENVLIIKAKYKKPFSTI